MAHPHEEEVWPVDTVIRDKKTGEFAIIRQVIRHLDGSFQYYLVEKEGKKGRYCAIHDRWEFEAPPK
jgi:hypothetical protein